MPVDYKLYPPNWKTEIRPRILARAKNRCEWCGVENKTTGQWIDGRWHQLGAPGVVVGYISFDGPPKPRIVTIVLTVAHIHNPDPMDCRDENLAALCQRCHNRHDMPMRLRNAAETRRKKRIAGGQGVLA